MYIGLSMCLYMVNFYFDMLVLFTLVISSVVLFILISFDLFLYILSCWIVRTYKI